MIDHQNIKKLSFFNSLPDLLSEKLIQNAEIIRVHKDDFIFKRNGCGNEFYIILNGQVGIANCLPENKKECLIQILLPGESVGETLLFNHDERLTDAIAMTEIDLLKINLSEINKLSVERPDLYSILLRGCGKMMSQRIKTSNDQLVHFQEDIHSKNKQSMRAENVFSYTILFMCLYALILKMVSYSPTFLNDFYIFIFLAAFIGVPSLILLKLNHYSAKDFGLSFENGFRHAAQAFLITLPFILLMILIKGLFIREGIHSLFGGVFISDEYKLKFHIKLAFLFSYLVSCPFQEFIARGVLQGSLERALTGSHSVLKSIVLSNIIFSTIHYYLSVKYGLMVFLPGLLWGYLYAKQKTIVGSTISHMLIGVFAIYFLGVDDLIN